MTKRSAASLNLGEIEHRALDMARNRLLATGIIFALVFVVMAARLVDLILQQECDHD